MQVCVGEKVSALINSDGHIFTWGLTNEQRQLGIDDQEPQPLPVLVSSLKDHIATQVEIGLDFCMALGQDCDRKFELPIQEVSHVEEVEEQEQAEEEKYGEEEFDDDDEHYCIEDNDGDERCIEMQDQGHKDDKDSILETLPAPDKQDNEQTDGKHELEDKITRLGAENAALKEELNEAKKENEFLINNAAEEIKTISDFIEEYQ